MRAPPPAAFAVRFDTTQGSFTVHVNSSWAPPMAQRFFALARLQYATGSPFYRVLRTNASHAFVSQWGYRGVPGVDQAWVGRQTSTATARVRQSNTRGSVAFGTSEIANNGNMPYCHSKLCSFGFSVELFVNLADNSRLDGSDFSPFGAIAEEDMAVVDRLYAGYGECSDLVSISPHHLRARLAHFLTAASPRDPRTPAVRRARRRRERHVLRRGARRRLGRHEPHEHSGRGQRVSASRLCSA